MDMRVKPLILFFLALLLVCVSEVARANRALIAASHDLAVETGSQIIRGGGNAADAAVAMALTLAVVEPDRSGLGGGGILLYHDRKRNEFVFVDYLESVSGDRIKSFIYGAAEKKTSKKEELKIESTGVPGLVAGLAKFHLRFGRLGWEKMFENALHHAKNGFELERDQLEAFKKNTSRWPDTDALRGAIHSLTQKDRILRQVELYQTLLTLQEKGWKEFYTGTLGESILSVLKQGGSSLVQDDFTYYDVRFGKPRIHYYRDLRVMSAGRPAFSGILLETLLVRAAGNSVNDTRIRQILDKALPDFFERYDFAMNRPADLDEEVSMVMVRDQAGNSVVMVNTLHRKWGSGFSVSGFVMNASGLSPSLVESLKTFDRNDDSVLKKRSVNFLLPAMIQRGFEDVGLMASGTISGVQMVFQMIQDVYFSGIKLSKLKRKYDSDDNQPVLLFVRPDKKGIGTLALPPKSHVVKILKY